MSILAEILEHKRAELEVARVRVPAEVLEERARQLEPAPRGFLRTLAQAPRPRVIAEIKRRSPSRGEIRPEFDPVAIARSYAEAGAAALSVLTDERYFGGSLEVLEAVRSATELPLLRKDFLLEPYQIYESRVAGADAILLIVAALPPERLAELSACARDLELDVLLEVHDEGEMQVARQLSAPLVGINNRDLQTFRTDLSTTERLAPLAPEGALVVAESGIFALEDLRRLEAAGARAFLVGESLMRQPDPGRALRRLRGDA